MSLLDPLKLLQKYQMVGKQSALASGNTATIKSYDASNDTFTIQVGQHTPVTIGASSLMALFDESHFRTAPPPSSSSSSSSSAAAAASAASKPGPTSTPGVLPSHQAFPHHVASQHSAQAQALSQVQAELHARVSAQTGGQGNPTSQYLQALLGSVPGYRDQVAAASSAPREWAGPAVGFGHVDLGVGGGSGSMRLHRTQFGSLAPSGAPWAPYEAASSLMHALGAPGHDAHGSGALLKRPHAVALGHDAVLFAESAKRARPGEALHGLHAVAPALSLPPLPPPPPTSFQALEHCVSSARPEAAVAPAAPASPSQGNTKTEIFAQIHSCYRSAEPGKANETVIPAYADIERKLALDNNINAARVATLRCRAIMRKALAPASHLLEADFADRVVVNCITALCPLCGRTIALNKLGSLENWCKHLSLHGSVGASLALRYRAYDKNAAAAPALHDIDRAQVLAWTALRPRPDAAPQNEDPRLCLPNRIPINSSIHWEVLVYSQLLNEGAFDYRSVVSQELMATGFKAYDIPFHGPTHLAVLTDMQSRLDTVPQVLEVYLGEDECHHTRVLAGGSKAETPSDGAAPSPEDATAAALRGKSALSRAIWCALHLKSKRSEKIAAVVRKCYEGVDIEAHGTVDHDLIEARLDEMDRAEHFGTRSRDAARLICTRRRQILDHALSELFPDDVERTRVGARVAMNSMMDSCPFCEKHFLAVTFALDHAIFLDHLRNCTVNKEASTTFAARLVAFGTNADDLECPSLLAVCAASDFFPSAPPRSSALRNDTMPSPRADVELSSSDVDANLALRMDWSALMFEALMRADVLSCKSVLTQEIVALGLFFFGLVNQRSPQKFGQYPQLHSFQVALHRAGPQGYDEYCGLGIRDQHLGSSHIRGRPVAVTSSILRAYRHLGLSAKSLKRFAASASRKQQRQAQA